LLLSGVLRLSKGSRPKKTMPSFGAAEKPAIDRPGKATESMMPGTLSAMALISRITASVRSSEAPAGSCAMPIRYCLSGAGTKPLGMRANNSIVRPSSTAYTIIAIDLWRSTPPTPRE
jgi:hypothetical protein